MSQGYYPKVYTGNFTLTPKDLWKEIIESHDGNGVITLNGHFSTPSINPNRWCGKLYIKTDTGATIDTRWNLRQSSAIFFDNIKFISSGLNIFWLDNSWMELHNCDIDGRGCDNTVAYINHSLLRCTGNSYWRCGLGAVQIIDAGDGSALKFIGNEQIVFELRDNADATAVVLDTSFAMFSDVKVDGWNSNNNGRGVDLRRASHLTLQGSNNRFELLKYGIISRQSSILNIRGVTFRSNATALASRSGGKIDYEQDTTSFSGNNTNISGDNYNSYS